MGSETGDERCDVVWVRSDGMRETLVVWAGRARCMREEAHRYAASRFAERCVSFERAGLTCDADRTAETVQTSQA